MRVLSVQYAKGVGKLPRHEHKDHQLLYISRGSIHATVDDRHFSLGEGELLLLGRFAMHDIEVK